VKLKIEAKTLILGSGIRDREDSILYVLPSPKKYERTLISVNNKEDIGVWHKRMAHMKLHDLRQAHKYCDVPKTFDVVDDGVCCPCREVEATKLPFRGSFEHADEVGDRIRSDMAGKLPTSFPDRYQYIPLFVSVPTLYAIATFVSTRRACSSQHVYL
jgi:hypothetical protein